MRHCKTASPVQLAYQENRILHNLEAFLPSDCPNFYAPRPFSADKKKKKCLKNPLPPLGDSSRSQLQLLFQHSFW